MYGDNGVIALLVGCRADSETLEIESWLMSCRVLGRNVEDATLNLLVEQAGKLGCKRVIGTYRPTAKNGMVRDHYKRLGFTQLEPSGDTTRWELSIARHTPRSVPMTIKECTTWTTLTSIAT